MDKTLLNNNIHVFSQIKHYTRIQLTFDKRNFYKIVRVLERAKLNCSFIVFIIYHFRFYEKKHPEAKCLILFPFQGSIYEPIFFFMYVQLWEDGVRLKQFFTLSEPIMRCILLELITHNSCRQKFNSKWRFQF